MNERISRRGVLSTTAASTLLVSAPGCLDELRSESSGTDDATDDAEGDSEDDGRSDDDHSDDTERYKTACEAGIGFLESTFDGEFEAAGEYYPTQYLEEYDRDDFVDYLEDRFADTVDDYALAATDCAESTTDHDAIEAAKDELNATVSDAEWLTYELDLEGKEEERSESIDVLAVRIEETWYAGVVGASVGET
ncbi:hypothetical protein [Natronorubrum daqingense]|uniref:Uncharacterized protein n=1 Tax=Natronorubrum daqingense TaxID=588898 RepID=A0A1N7A9G5_9EURY|nr:hypothetical protein [Natronorubrum daqingense]APX98067.1 hypothetical protein BB347_16395 [Natronorubrum daqingense]SIR35654.1 hypothetical protein SAMN05421809_1081 [Natronorubrum daqingense]